MPVTAWLGRNRRNGIPPVYDTTRSRHLPKGKPALPLYFLKFLLNGHHDNVGSMEIFVSNNFVKFAPRQPA
jgi:hypothetical protein